MGGLGKRPRHYAAAYLAARTPGEQKQALAGCPVEWRDLVRAHIQIIRKKQRG